MYISRLILKNWRNFKSVDTELCNRVFIVGPNASGKSNFLDAIRFLRDISRTGLQSAVEEHGGISKIRCLAARKHSDIEIEFHLSEYGNINPAWRYALSFAQIGGGIFETRAKIKFEKVWDENGQLLLNRPDKNTDLKDEKLLEFTHLEQATSNAKFRDVAEFLADIQYLHVVPQLIKDSKSFLRADKKDDYYGRDLIERINRVNEKTRHSYLRKIENALKSAVPQLKNLALIKDKMGIPHLQALYEHWRAKGARQWEDQFSDGTLRLIGFLWSLMDGTKPILLEEPEISLHTSIIAHLPEIIARLQKKKSGIRQIFISTHSAELLSNKGIGAEEVLLLNPSIKGTEVRRADTLSDVEALLKSDMSIGEAVIPKTAPKNIHQLTLQF
jgi:predicted ATPase